MEATQTTEQHDTTEYHGTEDLRDLALRNWKPRGVSEKIPSFDTCVRPAQDYQGNEASGDLANMSKDQPNRQVEEFLISMVIRSLNSSSIYRQNL